MKAWLPEVGSKIQDLSLAVGGNNQDTSLTAGGR